MCGNQIKPNGDIMYGNNGVMPFEDDQVLGATSGNVPYEDNRVHASTGSQLLRIDGNADNSFPLQRKDYFEETPYYTDLDIFKPCEDPPKNNDGNFLSPSIEMNNPTNQYSPSAPSPVVSVGEDTKPKKKVKLPRKTPSKKRKAADNENSMMAPSVKLNDESAVNSNYSNSFNFGDGNRNFPSSSNDSNNESFSQYSIKPESTTLPGKVKTPRKTPTKKKKVPDVNYSASVDPNSLKIKLKCEKSIGTENEERSISVSTSDRLSELPTAQTISSLTGQTSFKSPDYGRTDAPEAISRLNETEPISNCIRDSAPGKSQPQASCQTETLKGSSIVQNKQIRPLGTSKTKCPTAKAPSYLTGFPMRCPEYPIVYCCNHCARIFTSIRGGQLHECVIKRRGRKAAIKSE